VRKKLLDEITEAGKKIVGCWTDGQGSFIQFNPLNADLQGSFVATNMPGNPGTYRGFYELDRGVIGGLDILFYLLKGGYPIVTLHQAFIYTNELRFTTFEILRFQPSSEFKFTKTDLYFD